MTMRPGSLFDTWVAPPSLRSRRSGRGEGVTFPRAMRVDASTGLLVTDGNGRSVVLDGDAAFAQWVGLTVRNQRDAHRLLPRWYGVHTALVLAQSTPDEQRAAFEREVRATLMPPADARTGSVAFAWEPQSGRRQRCNVTVTSVRGLESRHAVEVSIG